MSHHLVSASILLVSIGCATGPPLETACADAVGIWGSTPPTWNEIWRVGGAGSEVELAMPMAFNVAPDGSIAIPDFRLGLAGVSAQGEWLGNLTRPGEGPGEVGMPFAAAYGEDGSLAVLDFHNAKVVVLDGDGELIEEHRVDGEPLSAVMRSGALHGLALMADGTAFLALEEADAEEALLRQTLLRLNPGGSRDTIARTTAPTLATVWDGGMHIRAPGWPSLVFAVDPGGRIAYTGDTIGYSIALIESDGARRSLCRSVEGLPLRSDETSLPDVSPETVEYDRALAAAPRPSSPAAVSRLLVGRSGQVWAERERPGSRDAMGAFIGRPGGLFDVFDADGTYLGELRAPKGVHVMATDADRAWGLAYDEFDAPIVIAYRLDTD